MVMNASVPSGSEIFNSYGQNLSNSELLVQYGFVLDVNENDRVHITLTDAGLPSNDLEFSLEDWEDTFEDSSLVTSKTVQQDTKLWPYWIDSEGRISLELWLGLANYYCKRRVSQNSDAGECVSMSDLAEDVLVYEGVAIPEQPHMESSHESILSDIAISLIAMCNKLQKSRGPEGVVLGDAFDVSSLSLCFCAWHNVFPSTFLVKWPVQRWLQAWQSVNTPCWRAVNRHG